MAYVNRNQCFSFNLTADAVSLSALPSYTGSEVLITNRTGGPIYIYDNDRTDPTQSFLIEDNESVTIRGITNTNQVSCVGTTGLLYCRSQFFSLVNSF